MRKPAPPGWLRTTLGAVTTEHNHRVGRRQASPVVLSCTKHHGLVPSDEYFKNRTIYSADLSNYKLVANTWFAYATNHLAEGSIGLQESFAEACVSPIYTVFSCDEQAWPPFMYRVLKSWRAIAQYQLHEQATVDRRGAIRYRDFAKIDVVLPPASEQRQIAAILDTIDDTIGKTERIVAKLMQVKQGLLHDLLTRGIDDNGELRDPERHPEHFKDSALGRTPRGWDVVRLREVYREKSKNGLYKPSNFHGRGPLMVQMGNIFKGMEVSFEGAGRVAVSASELSAYGLRNGDLLFGRRSLALEGAGKCALVRELPEDTTFESSIVRVRVDERRVIPLFAALFLSSEQAYRDRLRFIRQVAVSGVSSSDIGAFWLPIPSLGEQRSICARIEALNSDVEREARAVQKLRLLKLGLMEDLLTGRVRVTNLLENAPT